MERIRETEVNSDREVCDVINRLIDNQNQIEGKLLHLVKAVKGMASKSWVGKLLAPKKESKTKGDK